MFNDYQVTTIVNVGAVDGKIFRVTLIFLVV